MKRFNCTFMKLNNLSPITELVIGSLDSESLIIDDALLSTLTSLTDLYVSSQTCITSDGIKNLTKLTTLTVSGTAISYTSLLNLTSLTDLSFNPPIHDEVLTALTNLKRLEITEGSLTDEAFKVIAPNLEILNIGNISFTDKSLSTLTRLSDLTSGNIKLSPLSIKNFSSLSSLHIYDQAELSLSHLPSPEKLTYLFSWQKQDQDLERFINLKQLCLSNSACFSDNSLRSLTNLTSLDLNSKSIIHEETLLRFTKLTYLTLRFPLGEWSLDTFLQMTNLTTLRILKARKWKKDDFSVLTNLGELTIRHNPASSESN